MAVGNTTGKLENKGFNVISCCCFPLGAFRNRRSIQARHGIAESEDGTMCAVGLCLCCAYRARAAAPLTVSGV